MDRRQNRVARDLVKNVVKGDVRVKKILRDVDGRLVGCQCILQVRDVMPIGGSGGFTNQRCLHHDTDIEKVPHPSGNIQQPCDHRAYRLEGRIITGRTHHGSKTWTRLDQPLVGQGQHSFAHHGTADAIGFDDLAFGRKRVAILQRAIQDLFLEYRDQAVRCTGIILICLNHGHDQ